MSSTSSSPPTNIRYVVLSDLHLGQDRSVLTAVEAADDDPAKPTAKETEPALKGLMDCLRYLVEKNASTDENKIRPTLILLGDIIEQAFTDIEIAGPIFQRFVEQWKGKDGKSIFGDVVFIPGNHDHNMWGFTRTYQYWKCLKERSEKALQEPPPKPSCPSIPHTTALRTGHPSSEDLIGLLINRQLAVIEPKPLNVDIYYPTFALSKGKRAVLFNHGHYFEPLYHAMSTLLTYVSPTPLPPPQTAEDIERNNFAWLDFIWSTLARQGALGHELERLYDSFARPEYLKEVAVNIIKKALASIGVPEGLITNLITNAVADAIVKYITGGLETVSSSEDPLSSKTIEKMREYWNGPLRKQIDSDQELSRTTDRTLVFGHTHKPFKNGPDEHYPVKVYNTGGWVIDPLPKDKQLHRGGSCLLLNDELDITSIQFYRQVEVGLTYKVKAESLEDTEFHLAIKDLIANDSDDKVFQTFSKTVATSVKARLEQKPGR